MLYYKTLFRKKTGVNKIWKTIKMIIPSDFKPKTTLEKVLFKAEQNLFAFSYTNKASFNKAQRYLLYQRCLN